MTEDAGDDAPRPLITPPPGLLPPARPREADAPVNTGSETRKISRSDAPPVFFPAASGRPDPEAAPAPPREEGPRAWVVELRDGSTHEVSGDGLAVGRNPSAPEDHPAAAVLEIDDPERSVSKTHALFRLVGEEVHVTDLASTNGVHVTTDGAAVRLRSGVETVVAEGASVALGSYPVLVARRRP